MKIGIDISQIVYGTGVSDYTKNLVKNLLAIDKKNDYLLFAGSLRKRKSLELFSHSLKSNFQSKFFSFPPILADLVWNRWHILPIETLIGKLDLFHSSDWTQPPARALKVTTIHDLAPFKFPQLTPRKILSVHRARLGWIKKEVDIIIAVSQSTKEDLLELGFPEKKIKVVHEAAGKIFMPQKRILIKGLMRKYRIHGSYIMAVGLDPRKNIDRLINAYEKVRAGENLKLVLVGRPWGRTETVRGVRYLGHITDKELAILYSAAEALVYPSLYEGFGLPILQAMACGCPVVASNLSSMPEISAGAAILVDPYEVDSISQGIEKAFKERKTLIKKGLERAKQFSWQKTARQTLKIYQELSPK